jgi:hypothetical protein
MNETELFCLSDNLMIIIDAEHTEEVKEQHMRRLFCKEVQNLRKRTSLHPWDKINIYYDTKSRALEVAIKNNYDLIVEQLLYDVYPGRCTEENSIASVSAWVLENPVYISLEHKK